MRIILSSLLLFTLFFSTAQAGVCSNCKIQNIGVGPNYDGTCTSSSCVFVKMDGNYTGEPSCAAGYSGWDFTIDTSTESGRVSYAFLLSAHAADKAISIGGTNTCSNWGQMEDFHWATFN